MRRTLLLAALCALLGCGDGAAKDDRLWIAVRAAPGSGLEPSAVRFDPELTVVEAVRTAPDAWAVAVPRDAAPPTVTVHVPGACPEEVGLDLGSVPEGEHAEVTARPMLRVDPIAQVGYGAPFRLEVSPGCRDAIAGGIEWEQVSGLPVETTAERNGWVLRGRTPTFDEAHGGPVPWGVVPVSPRTRGEAVFRGTWRGAQQEPIEIEARVAAVPRATGLPSVPVGGRVLLGGEGWRVEERPRGSRAEVEEAGPVHALGTDAVGLYRLRDADDRELALRVGRYDDTTLDCGRAECHASAAEHAASTAMTSVLARGLEGGLGERYDPGCALGCHAVGEPGLPDGGFWHVARESELVFPHQPSPGAWDALPVALRRLGGVGCLACHGPGAIPAPESRWAILRSDVCAVCHDAPPRYGHVAAWAESAMAKADADPRVRADRSCAGCHTTWGFLDRIGVREAQRPPEDVGAIGIGCAACHAPHGDHVGVALLRNVQSPSSVAQVASGSPERSRVCLSCHAPLDHLELPSAAAAALWLGSGGREIDNGGTLRSDAVHADVEGGCVGCHAAGPEDLERGAAHAFDVTEAQCVGCHESGDALARASETTERLHGRARALRDRLVAARALRASSERPDDPIHAGGTAITDASSPLGRAAWNVLLVLEDGAAGAHGPAHAEAFLDAAESALER